MLKIRWLLIASYLRHCCRISQFYSLRGRCINYIAEHRCAEADCVTNIQSAGSFGLKSFSIEERPISASKINNDVAISLWEDLGMNPGHIRVVHYQLIIWRAPNSYDGRT